MCLRVCFSPADIAPTASVRVCFLQTIMSSLGARHWQQQALTENNFGNTWWYMSKNRVMKCPLYFFPKGYLLGFSAVFSLLYPSFTPWGILPFNGLYGVAPPDGGTFARFLAGIWKGRDFTCWNIWKGREICHFRPVKRLKSLIDAFYRPQKSQENIFALWFINSL